MKKRLGWVLLSLPFVALFIRTCFTVGLVSTIVGTCAFVAVAACILLGTKLLTDD